ncbi:MAG: TonB-dependent receptor [Dysgonomonas sp.]|nr:TonB-dependent receptor [Dysgonomonas sp.]
MVHVKGKITDFSTGETLIGVSVVPKNSPGNGTVTDLDGAFSLNVTKGTVLVISYIGYETVEIPATSETINIKLKESAELLDEVVVIGYGSVKRKDVTTAISTVSTKDLDQRPIVSAGQAIQGRAAGVSVIQPNGAPGGEISIRVRGTTSFNGSNDPLYVVDGVPVDNINFLAPTDIANMQILKDASSAAIYGSRAANGVIIITTKAGQSGEAKVSFNAQLSLNKVSNKIKSLNAADYKELQAEIGAINANEIGDTDLTNWFDEVYQTGITQSYQVSVSDGTDKLKYFLSAGYLDEKGVLDAAIFKRYSFRANIDNQVRKWLNVSANISYTENIKNGITTGQGATRGGIVLSVVNLPTSVPVFDAETGHYNRSFYGMNIGNPLESMNNGKNNKNKENRLIASGSTLITFIPELTLKSSFTLDRRNGLETGFTPPLHTDDRDDWGSAWDNRNMNTVITLDNILTYTNTFGKHGLEAMAGTSWTDSDYTNSWINGTHFRNSEIKTLNAANKITWNNTGSGASQWGIMSYFGRAAYNYDSKYLFTANMRADGSSKLHPDHRWGTFPSFSAAWRMSSEEFMQGIEWLDDLKIRGGWGQTGNQSGIGDYAYLQRYNISRVEWFEKDADGNTQENALPIISQANLRTKDLKWETTTQTNIGLDFTAFNNRLTVNMDYYYKRTKDMLMWVTLPTGAAAANSIQRNEGEMTNKGFEFSVSSRNLQGVFNWNTDFNISFNKNRLEKLELQKIYTDGWTSDVLHEPVVRNEPGRSLGGFFGYISDGVDPETGELMYRDLTGDGKITSTDRTYIGDPNPDFTFGMTNTFSWKDFNLSIFIQGSYGNDIYNCSRIETEGMYDGKNQSTRVLKRWRVPGQETNIPKANFDIKNSSYFVEDGSYLRVKDISLSYNFRGGILNRLGVSRLQPYFTATNLITWTSYKGMDPEVNQWGNSGAVQGIDWGTYPHSKSFVFGVNVEF